MRDGGRTGDIGRYLAGDHARLDALLQASTARPRAVDPGPFADFRLGILRHIAIEEKLLLPAAQAAQGAPLDLADRLRLDHGAIAALLVPSPTPAIVATIRHILTLHNALEEGPDGVYAACDGLLADRAASVVEQMERYPPVRASGHNDAPGVPAAVERALARAGYLLLPPPD